MFQAFEYFLLAVAAVAAVLDTGTRDLAAAAAAVRLGMSY
jgi:hypothetical protein